MDDCSTDETRQVAEAHELRPRYYLQEVNGGASVARNRGVDLARGEIIVFLDSDDVLEPDHHATVLKLFGKSPAIGLMSCDCEMIGPKGEPLYADTWTNIQSRIKAIPIGSGPRSLAEIYSSRHPFQEWPFAGTRISRLVA